MARLGMARLGSAWQSWLGLARHGMAGQGGAGQGSRGMAGLGAALLGSAWRGSAWPAWEKERTAMDLKRISEIQETVAKLDQAVQKALASASNEDLAFIAFSLLDSTPDALATHIAASVRDTSAILSLVYFKELFRRMEVEAMENAAP
jgi:hypothetical protein